MAESWATRLTRWGFNLMPVYRGTGARITYIAADWREIRIALPLNRRTRNYVGTIFGGSMYASVDPVYMIMLIRALGRDYVVWDKSGAIQYRRPGKQTLTARFVLDEAELEQIRFALQSERSIDRDYEVQLVDPAGETVASIRKTIYIRRKDRASTAP
jgi:acyl-coenzyme A thioesterase PaaI-like protein